MGATPRPQLEQAALSWNRLLALSYCFVVSFLRKTGIHFSERRSRAVQARFLCVATVM